MISLGSDLSTFGELLKVARKRRKLTQQQLAGYIGVHRNTIGGWEQGDYLPESKALVLELARHLHLNDQDARRLLEASMTALAPHWLVPLRRNPFFTGREDMLETLYRSLTTEQEGVATRIYALYGMGGVGKTQLVLEYAYRHALEYSAVFWIEAETEESIVLSLERIATVLQLPEQGDRNQQRVVAAVQRWLTTHDQWLMIWDDVDDFALLERFLPATRQGVVLLTTCRRAIGTLARSLELLPMESEEATLFLLRRARVLDPLAEAQSVFAQTAYPEAVELALTMGGLPLALDQAGAYIEETQCGLAAYLEVFQVRSAALLAQRGEDARDHPASVAATFRLALASAVRRHPAMREFLGICALLQPEAIPEQLFRQEAAYLGPVLQTICSDPLEWNRLVAAACAHSLLGRQPEQQTLSLHRVVRAVLLDAMTRDERREWGNQAIAALDKLFPHFSLASDDAAWKLGQRLLPHALACLEQVGETSESLALASLAGNAALVLGGNARAEALVRCSLSIRERLLGPDHPLVAASLRAMGDVFEEKGQYAESGVFYQRALATQEHQANPDPFGIASSLQGLAFAAWRQGQYEQAETCYRRALDLFDQMTELHEAAEVQALHGAYKGSALHGLALLYEGQGSYEEAEPLYQRAAQVWEEAMGADNFLVAHAYTNLANIYRARGSLEQAEALYRRARGIWEQSMGEDHPWLAYALHGLAQVAQEQARHAEAEALFQRVLLIQERSLGKSHPDVAQTLYDLALFRVAQGQTDEARTLATRALSIRVQVLGTAHPKTIATRQLCAQFNPALEAGSGQA